MGNFVYKHHRSLTITTKYGHIHKNEIYIQYVQMKHKKLSISKIYEKLIHTKIFLLNYVSKNLKAGCRSVVTVGLCLFFVNFTGKTVYFIFFLISAWRLPDIFSIKQSCSWIERIFVREIDAFCFPLELCVVPR